LLLAFTPNNSLQQIVQPPPDPEAGVQDHVTDWANLMITFVLAFAPTSPLAYAQIYSNFSPTFHLISIEILLSFAQIYSKFSPAFHLISIEILLSFAAFFVSKFIKSKFPMLARWLDIVSIFFSVTAFFTAITIPFPLYLQIITWVVYAISILAISVSVLNQDSNQEES